MAYASWNVSFGEQPSAAKWNILGTNDASFNDGSGFGNNIVQGKHIDTNLNAGWIDPNETWTYASATTITVPSDATNKYAVGDKIKLVQSATTKYFYITNVAATVLTVNGGSDYTVANSAISGQYYSHATSPAGFPHYFNYSPTLTNVTEGNGSKVAKFNIIGKMVNYWGIFTFGNSSSMGTSPSIGLPINLSSSFLTTDNYDIGWAHIQDDGTAALPASLRADSASTLALLIWSASGTYVAHAGVTSTVPMVWTTNDSFSWNISYPIS